MTAPFPTIVEVGPRDGLQNEAKVVPTPVKLDLIARAVRAGIRRIEAVSFVNPRLVPQMADAEAVMAGVPRVAGVSYIGLVLNERGLDRALATGVDEANVVLVASETFSRRNQNIGIDDMVDAFGRIADRARSAGLRVSATIGASFGCPFEGEVPTARVASIAARVAALGAQEVALADTIGVGVPADVHRLVGAVREETDLPLRIHLHNTRNTGYANAVAAVAAGVVALDASIGGIGGCPFAPAATGNIATEDLLYLLRRSGYETGVDLPGIVAAAEAICAELGIAIPALLGRAGDFPPVTTAP
jgi:hydroxymethylglutaryl-CoA lyase